VLLQYGFELTQFNPEATNLDLQIDTAEVFELVIRGSSSEIAGAV
jgi:hypothetical protein